MATNGKKKTRKRIIIIGVAGLVLATLALVLFLGSKRETVLPVQAEEVARRTITQVVTATGKIQPEIMVKITPEVSGEIIDLPVREGQKVSRGDLLVKIKPDTYIAQRDQAAAGLLQAKATLSRTEPEYERVASLYDKGLVSKAEYDQAKAQYESSKASMAQAEATLNRANEDLLKTTIRSPMNGTVSQLNSELGERVLGTSMMQGTDIMTIADLSRMEARVEVSENDVILVSVGDTARIEVDAFPDKKVNAVVYEIANTATTRGLGTQEEVTNFEVKIRVLGQDLDLRPGMSMTADVETETRADVLSVPIQSVTTRMPKQEQAPEGEDGQSGRVVQASNGGQAKGNGPKLQEIVFVVEDGTAKAIPVKRGISDDSHVEITEGVEEGMKVVSGSYRAINRDLEDGAKVRIQEPRRGGPQAGPQEGAAS